MGDSGFYIAFEGIDGSGKTTLATRVGEALKASGIKVSMLRPGGRYRDPVAESLRDLARDPHNLQMSPDAELLIAAAREAQLVARSAVPDLAAGHVVIADRSPSTLIALSHHGRGLPLDRVQLVAQAAAAGRWPDLTILVDVDVLTSRLRKAAASAALIEDGAFVRTSGAGRKGLSGLGLRARMAQGYRQMAKDGIGGRWLVVDNRRVRLDDQVEYLATMIRALIDETGGSAATSAEHRFLAPPLVTLPPRAPAFEECSDLEDWYLATIAEEAQREPSMACMLLRSLQSSPSFEVRRALAATAPAAVLASIWGIASESAELLRALLEPILPASVAASQSAVMADAQSDARRERLFALAPRTVLSSLGRRQDDFAESLWRKARGDHADLQVMRFAGQCDDQAWVMRRRHVMTNANEVLLGLAGLDDDEAWQMRKNLGRGREHWLLASVSGLVSERAWRVRESIGPLAPKTLAGTLNGIDDERAWSMRERFLCEAKEFLDSIVAMAGARPDRLREMGRDIWPSTAVSSLGSRDHSEAAWRFRREQVRRHPGDLLLIKHVVRALEIARSATVAFDSNNEDEENG